MRIIYTEHALVRMNQRNILAYEIQLGIKNPTIQFTDNEEITTINYRTEKGLLEIICKKSHTTCIVITCYYL